LASSFFTIFRKGLGDIATWSTDHIIDIAEAHINGKGAPTLPLPSAKALIVWANDELAAGSITTTAFLLTAALKLLFSDDDDGYKVPNHGIGSHSLHAVGSW
jgi:hypothetical protein